MSIIKKYKIFVNESIDSGNDIKQISDVPKEVFETSKKIVSDIYDKVRKPTFEIEPENGLVLKFVITEQDFNYVDTENQLTLDLGEGAKKKRTYDVTLTYLDKISETFEIKYKVDFEMSELSSDDEYIVDDEDDDIEIEDNYYKHDDDDIFDDDEIEKNFKLNKFDEFDNLDNTDIVEDDISNEEFNPFIKKDWREAGDKIRKGIGFLTPEEEIEEGKKKVFSHPNRFKVYTKLDPDKADKYLIFWANHDVNATPVWNEEIQDFEDKSIYTRNTGPGGNEPW